jgi:hypothetical protein
MLDKLKADFDGIVELVKKAPPALQEMAFKMILEQWFIANTAARPAPVATLGSTAAGAAAAPGTVPETIKPFLTANAITTEILEKVFHPTGPGAQLLASVIPGNGKAGKLVSLSLLLGVRHALESGVFTCTLKDLRGDGRPLRLLRLPKLLENAEGEQELLQTAGEGCGP